MKISALALGANQDSGLSTSPDGLVSQADQGLTTATSGWTEGLRGGQDTTHSKGSIATWACKYRLWVQVPVPPTGPRGPGQGPFPLSFCLYKMAHQYPPD